jgi:CheY-like chemotaxis protein
VLTPKRILVVDDDGSIVRLVATILRRERYDVDTATGGREALTMIERTPYDVIVLDLMMPEVSGLDVLRSFHDRAPNIKCIVIMSAASSLDIERAINPNVFAALRKPFEISALLSVIQGCIACTCDPSRAILVIPPGSAP